MKITLAAWARKIRISRSRALEWAKTKRIKAINPTKGVWLIDETEKRPEKLRPWHYQRKERIELESL